MRSQGQTRGPNQTVLPPDRSTSGPEIISSISSAREHVTANTNNKHNRRTAVAKDGDVARVAEEARDVDGADEAEHDQHLLVADSPLNWSGPLSRVTI